MSSIKMTQLGSPTLPSAPSLGAAASPAPRPPLAAPLPPPPFRPVRLAPGAPWFFSEEQRLRLRSSALVSAPDLSQPPRPTSAASASDPAAAAMPTSPFASRLSRLPGDPGELVPDSLPPLPGLDGALAPSACIQGAERNQGEVSSRPSAAMATGAFNAASRLRSAIIIPPGSDQAVFVPPGCPRTPDDVPSSPREEAGWTAARRPRRPRRDAPSSRPAASPAHPAALHLEAQRRASQLHFKRRTEGLCSRCLAPQHHRSVACRDPIRCLSCKLSGHTERKCPLRSKPRPPPPRLPPSTAARPRSSPTSPGASS
ncbi:hypothetical protein VPH35_001698 [Triticum aestivum]